MNRTSELNAKYILAKFHCGVILSRGKGGGGREVERTHASGMEFAMRARIISALRAYTRAQGNPIV